MTVMAASEAEIDADGAMQKLSRIKAIVAASAVGSPSASMKASDSEWVR